SGRELKPPRSPRSPREPSLVDRFYPWLSFRTRGPSRAVATTPNLNPCRSSTVCLHRSGGRRPSPCKAPDFTPSPRGIHAVLTQVDLRRNFSVTLQNRNCTPGPIPSP